MEIGDNTLRKPIFVTKSSIPSLSDYTNELKSVFESHWLTNFGEKHNKLQSQLQHFLDVDNVSLFTNGHLALELTIQAFAHKYRWERNRMVTDVGTAEVITTPFTFISTTHAIVRNGLKPVFADIDPNTCCITPETIEPLINEKTVAIIPVHVYGNICDVNGINKLAKKYNLKIIYDAAHAFGETFDGKGIANYGDASIFSFHATKVFNTIEGGACCFNDREKWIEELLNNLKNFGIKNEEEITGIGSNAKMNEFQAAMGLCNLKSLTKNTKMRQKIAEIYFNNLSDSVKCLLVKSKKCNYAYFPVRFKNKQTRDNVYSKLAKNNIFARKYFYPLTNDAESYALIGTNNRIWSSNGENGSNPTPIAKQTSDTVLTLPLFSDLNQDDAVRISKIINEVV